MGKKLAVMGSGAVGSYAGGFMSLAGEDVTLIDPWPEHVQAINQEGLHLSGTQGDHLARPRALHLHDVQSLSKDPVDIAFVCTKSYDTIWATELISQYLKPGGFIVSLQNSINEERIASVVGWGRVVGCVASSISVNLFAPGHVVRTIQPGGPGYTVFRVGEPHCRITARAEEVAGLMSTVDTAKPTTNLWGERWTKLVVNTSGNGVSAITGLGTKEMLLSADARRLTIQLAGEAIAVGQGLGLSLEKIRGIEPDLWVAAAQHDARAMSELDTHLQDDLGRYTDEGRPSTGQDIVKGRRTEIDYLNGLVADRSAEAGIPAPTHTALVSVVHDVERGEFEPSPRLIDEVWRLAEAESRSPAHA